MKKTTASTTTVNPVVNCGLFKNVFAFLLVMLSLGSLQNSFGQAYTITWQGLTGNTGAQNVPAGVTVVTQYNGVTGSCVTTPSNGANTSYSAVLRATAGFNFTITSIGGTAYGSSAGSKDFTIQLTNGANTYTSATTRIGSSSSCGGNDALTALSVPAAGQTVTAGNQVTITILRAPGGATGGGYSYTKTLTVTGVVSPACSNGTITLTSGNNTQTVNQNASISNITYSIGGGANNASASGLPAGVTGSYSSGTFTISGAPSVTGSFPYTVTATGGCSNVTATGTITVNTVPPTVTTTTVSSITSSGAVGGGNVISAGSTTVTARGVVYGTTANPTIAGTKTTNGSGTGVFTSTISGLQPNTQYFYRAYATNSVNTSYGSESNFYTLSTAPGAPIVNAATTSSLNVAIASDGNSAATTYAIRETGSGNYVQANGTLGATAVWQTATAWGSKTVPGLIAARPYNFQVKARNFNNIETAFGATANKSTLANIPGAPVVDGATFSSLNVTIDQNNNSAFAEYAIYEITTGNFVQADGTLGALPVWQIADLWGTKTVIDLASLTQYSFQVAARNPDLIETVFGPGADGTTLDASTPFLSATPLSSFTDVCINTTTVAASFTLSGQNLTADDLIIAALTGYSYSTDENGPFTATLTISQPGGEFSQTIFVIFTPTVAQSYDGSIVANGGGASDLNINATGNGINTTPTVVATGTSGIGINGATVSANITLTGCSPVTTYGVEYSTVPGFTNGTGTPVPGMNLVTNSFSVSVSSLNTNTVYYYHAYATNNGGTSYSSEGNLTTLNPTLSATALTGFGNVCLNNTAGPNTFTITGVNLSNANVTVAALSGYSYSTDDVQYFPSLSISQPGGSFSQLIYVKFTPASVQSYNGNIVIGGGGVPNINEAVTGAGINTAASVTTGSSSAITQTTATLAGTITATGCTAVTAYGIEYSTVNGFTNGAGTAVAGSNLSGNAYSVSLNNLGANTTYYYKAYATNNAGTSYGTQQSFITTALSAPVATAATSILSTSFVANWNAVNGASSYRLDVSPSSTFVDPNSAAATTLAGWSFPTSGTIVTPDVATTTPNNTAKTLTSNAGTIGTVSGVTTQAATVTDWSNGLNTKYWQVTVDATGYYGLTISSKQQSSNTGPANFKLQYSVNGGAFGDVPSGSINVQNNFTSGVVANLALPAACYNQPNVAIRWLITSTTAVNGGTTAATGTSRIDDIAVKGGNTPLFVSGYNNLTVNGTSQLVSGLTANTTYYYRVRAFSTNSTSPNSNVITVQTCLLVPTITGNSSFCQGGSVVLTSSANATYQWNLDGNPINGENNQTITVTTAGDYSVTATNASGCTGTSAIKTITVNPNPAVPTITAQGPVVFCQGESVVLSSSSATGNQWKLNGNNINGETNQTINVTGSGDYSVTVTNGSNCSASSVITTVKVNNLPAVPTISPNAATSFCEGGSVVLTSSALTGNQWNLNGATIIGETNQILTVTGTGSYSVTVANGFGCNATSTITAVTVNPLPANPVVAITQPGCSVATGTITVTSPVGTGLSYSISGPSGSFQTSTSFAGLTPGDYTVIVKNEFDCIVSAASVATINPQPVIPSAPVVSGIVNVCPYLGTGEQLTYTASSTGATSYTWQLPPNVSIISGGTPGNSVTVSFPAGFSSQANKQIKVTASSVCGNSPSSIYYLLTQFPITPNPITGPVNVCTIIGTSNTVTYKTNRSIGALSYVWSTPANAVVTHPNGTGVNDTLIVVSFNTGFAGGQVSVTAANGCGTSGTRTLNILNAVPSAPGLIGGTTNACGSMLPNGVAATYTISSLSTATSYIWTAPPGAVITHPNANAINDTTITVLFPAGFTAGTITVTATNGCGTGALRSLAITKLNPATPSVIDVIQTHFCDDAQGRVYTYTLASMPSNAASVQWTIPAGATLLSGQGSTSIAVSYPATAVSGIITAQAISNCAVSTLRSAVVKLPACPTAGFAGKQNNTQPVQQISKPISPAVAAGEMEINVYPNPSINDFNLKVIAGSTEKISARLISAEGIAVKTFTLVSSQSISFGNDLKPGVYMLEVRQGTKVKTTRIIRY